MKKTYPRITIIFFEGNNRSNPLFRIDNVNSNKIGNYFSDKSISTLINQSIREKCLPNNVTVVVCSEFKRTNKYFYK